MVSGVYSAMQRIWRPRVKLWKKIHRVRFGIVVTWWHQLASVFIGIELKIRYLKLPSFSKSSSPASRAKAHCKEHLFHGLSRMTVIFSRWHRPEPRHRGLSALARTQPRSPRWLRRRQARSDTSAEAGLFQGNPAKTLKCSWWNIARLPLLKNRKAKTTSFEKKSCTTRVDVLARIVKHKSTGSWFQSTNTGFDSAGWLYLS